MTQRPAAAPPAGYRPHMSLETKLHAALIKLGLDPAAVDFDHDPPLAMRVWDEAAGDTIPAANDPRYIVPRSRPAHREKTTGGATKARARGDITEIAKTKRLARKQHAHVDALEAKASPESPPARERPSRKWGQRKLQGRGFEKGKRPWRNGRGDRRRSTSTSGSI